MRSIRFFDKNLLMVSFAFSLYVMGDFLRVENKAETAQIRWVDKSVVYALSIILFLNLQGYNAP